MTLWISLVTPGMEVWTVFAGFNSPSRRRKFGVRACFWSVGPGGWAWGWAWLEGWKGFDPARAQGASPIGLPAKVGPGRKIWVGLKLAFLEGTLKVRTADTACGFISCCVTLSITAKPGVDDVCQSSTLTFTASLVFSAPAQPSLLAQGRYPE